MKLINRIKIIKYPAFTLIELLLVVGIIGIIAGIGGDMFATVMKAYRKAELFSLVERTGNNALTQIEQDLRSASSVNIPASGETITITLPGGNSKTYAFTSCTSSTKGDIKIGAASLLSNNNQTFYNTSLFVSQVGSTPYFTVITNTEGRQLAVFVSFYMSSGNIANDPCNVTSQRLVESFFQTTVNLRGGIN